MKTYFIEAEVTYRQTFTVEADDLIKAYQQGLALAKTEGTAAAVIIDGPNVIVVDED